MIEIPYLPSLGMAALYAVTFLLALASGLVPFVINTELYLLGVATLTSASPVLMVALATTGQMLGKWVVYGVGRGSLNIKWVRRVGASKAVRTFAGRPATTTSILAFIPSRHPALLRSQLPFRRGSDAGAPLPHGRHDWPCRPVLRGLHDAGAVPLTHARSHGRPGAGLGSVRLHRRRAGSDLECRDLAGLHRVHAAGPSRRAG